MSVKLPLADPSSAAPGSLAILSRCGKSSKNICGLWNNKAYNVRDCRISRIRYRRGDRCVLQYTLRLAEANTQIPRIQWVTGVMYADDKARRKWEKLRVSYPKEISGLISTFEPFFLHP